MTQTCYYHDTAQEGLLNFPAAAAAKSLQLCPTLCDPTESSPPGSAVPGILQARILEWVAISFSNASKWKGKLKSLSRDRLVATPWTSAYQDLPSMGFSRQEYWRGLPVPSPLEGDLSLPKNNLYRKDPVKKDWWKNRHISDHCEISNQELWS